MAKLPKPPPAGVVGFEEGHMDVIPALPAVLDRIRLPNGSFAEVSRAAASASPSSGSDSRKSLLRRCVHGEESSRENLPAAVGEARALLKGFDSMVSRRRVPGRVADEGEMTPNVFPEPWETEVFRPLTFPCSLLCVGGLSGELISKVNA